MYAEVSWVLVSSGTQGQPQIIIDPDYLPDYLSVSYDYTETLSLLFIVLTKQGPRDNQLYFRRHKPF